MARLVSADCPPPPEPEKSNQQPQFIQLWPNPKKRAPEGTPLVLLIGFVIIPLVVFYL